MLRNRTPHLSHDSRRRSHGTDARRPRRLPLGLESLEGRTLLSGSPTIYTVDSPSGGDFGSGTSGTLQFVVIEANANANPAGSLIEFDPSYFPVSAAGTDIPATSTLMLTETAGPEVIDGISSSIGPVITIDGGGSVQVFSVAAGTTASISNLEILHGSATDGGGIANSGSLTLTSCSVAASTAVTDGGDIYNTGSALTIVNSMIFDGSADDGGGIYNSGSLNVTGSTISSDSAATRGGGIYTGGTADISQSYFDGNTAEYGGGLANPAGTAVVSDSTFVTNTGFVYGAGLTNGSTLIAINDTIALNTIDSGGTGAGVNASAGDSTTLINTIVALNAFSSSAGGGASDIAGTLTTLSSNNLIGIGGSGGLTTGASGNLVGVASSALGFSSASLGFHGGSTPTIALAPNSPAIDAGASSLAIDPSTKMTLTTDQRGTGYPRIEDTAVDIGAYEYVPKASDLHLMVISQPPSTVSPGSPFTVTVAAETEVDTIASSYSGSVTLALSGGGGLGGTLTTSLAGGIATFSGLTETSSGTYTLTATSSAITSATSGSFTVTAVPQIIGEELIIIGAGRHRRVVGFELVFNAPMDLASTSNPSNYYLTQTFKRGRRVVSLAVPTRETYSAATQSVDIVFPPKATFLKGGQLKVFGSTPGGIMSAAGVALDGANTGMPGSNGVFTILPKIHGISR